jgi:hypothetical protein
VESIGGAEYLLVLEGRYFTLINAGITCLLSDSASGPVNWQSACVFIVHITPDQSKVLANLESTRTCHTDLPKCYVFVTPIYYSQYHRSTHRQACAN